MYRFKHLATDTYLTVTGGPTADAPSANASSASPSSSASAPPRARRRDSEASLAGQLPALAVTESKRDPGTLWAIDSTMRQPRRDAPVSADSFVRLQHVHTGGWVHSTQLMLDAVVKGKPNKKATMLKVVLTPHCDDNEAFGAQLNVFMFLPHLHTPTHLIAVF